MIGRMRRRPRLPLRLLAFLLLGGSMLASSESRACTCLGTTGIGTALSRAEVVIIGVVEGRQTRPFDPNDETGVMYPEAIAVKVTKSLEGNVAGKILITTDLFCYRSFDVEDFEVGQTYVFPISRIDENGLHVLPSCSHSALKVVDGTLYTHEVTLEGGRRLERYMSLGLLEKLFPTGLLNAQVQILIAGTIAIVAPLLLTPWLRKRSVAAQRPHPSRLRTRLAIAWMLTCTAVCAFIAVDERNWMLWVLSASFALATAGIAFRWLWSEGLSYGIVLLTIGIFTVATYDVVDWYLSQRDQFHRGLLVTFGIDFVVIAMMLWYADTVRRRFSRAAG
jgi:hypothetical protein